MTSPSHASPPSVMAVNGGSSSIKFALFATTPDLPRVLDGRIENIGTSAATFLLHGKDLKDNKDKKCNAPDHHAAVEVLMNWVADRFQPSDLAAVGHRVVHGGPKFWQPQIVTPELIETLRQLSPFDPEHLPEEIILTEAFHRRFPKLPQIACFDTAFHHDLPTESRLLPIPRRYEAKGVRRYGFHGLSCAYLMEELTRVAGPEAARGRVILAHLGNGASLTAVLRGKSIDTTMGFTPAAGIPMSTRSGDLDPGLAWYLSRVEKVSAQQFHHLINHESGLLGLSETSSDTRELLAHEKEDPRAADALAIFCYQARKSIAALAGALQGLDTVIFAGGIGENAGEIRARICQGLGFLGIQLHPERNRANAPIISADNQPVTVRVIRTDEEKMIARSVCQILQSSTPPHV